MRVIQIDGDVARIPLSQGRVALIDAEDAPKLERSWTAHKIGRTYYAAQRVAGRYIYLHRLIMDAERGSEVDHINGDGLDNRKANLRICTHAENLRNRVAIQKKNTSGFKGIYWHKGAQKWMAQISRSGERFYLGLHVRPEDAARAYDSAARRLFGEFASPNFEDATA